MPRRYSPGYTYCGFALAAMPSSFEGLAVWVRVLELQLARPRKIVSWWHLAGIHKSFMADQNECIWSWLWPNTLITERYVVICSAAFISVRLHRVHLLVGGVTLNPIFLTVCVLFVIPCGG